MVGVLISQIFSIFSDFFLFFFYNLFFILWVGGYPRLKFSWSAPAALKIDSTRTLMLNFFNCSTSIHHVVGQTERNPRVMIQIPGIQRAQNEKLGEKKMVHVGGFKLRFRVYQQRLLNHYTKVTFLNNMAQGRLYLSSWN